MRSLELLTALHEEHDISLNTPGSIRIVDKGNTDRLREAHQVGAFFLDFFNFLFVGSTGGGQ